MARLVAGNGPRRQWALRGWPAVPYRVGFASDAPFTLAAIQLLRAGFTLSTELLSCRIAKILPQPGRGTFRAGVTLAFCTRQFARQDHGASHADLIGIVGN
jgi:hypothetical protein